MRQASSIVRNVRLSEKGTRIAAHHQYLVDVLPSANKIEIRAAVQELFGVTVKAVNTMNCHGKWRRLTHKAGRRSDWKKAVVTLAEGQKIELKES